MGVGREVVRSALISSALGELTVKQLSRDLEVVHPDNMSCPKKLGFENRVFCELLLFLFFFFFCIYFLM